MAWDLRGTAELLLAHPTASAMTPSSTARSLALCFGFLTLPSHAALVTSLTDGTPISLPSVDLLSSGPIVIEPGITYESRRGPNSAYGWTDGYGFGNNGRWSGTPAMIGLNYEDGAMTVSFASPVSAFLAEVSWSIGTSSLGATMSALGGGDVVLEQWLLEGSQGNIQAPNAFYGFSRLSNDIVAIRFENEYIGARTMSYGRLSDAAVPVPAPLALLGLGMLAWGAATRVRRR